MGVGASKDILLEAENKILDLSHHLTPEQYQKHTHGECLEGSLLELPAEMYYNTVSLYESVDASFNFIGMIPPELSLHVPHLRHLDLSHNQLTSLPPTFRLLLHLRTLRLAHNRFKQFPTAAVTALPSLNTLDLSHNLLRELPNQGWSKMTQLERLNVSHNQLHLLPNLLCECSKLTVLVVKGNQLMHPPQHVCAAGTQSMLGYLRHQATLGNNSGSLRITTQPASPVFRRVRGDHVSATVSNPDSAWRQYQQGSYTGPGNKRKCPMMPPRDATTLPPRGVTQTLMGLVYGAAVAESVGLSCEGLDPSEVLFYYSPASLAPDTRIRDHLRSHYPKQDWGPLADLMLITLESVLRWGGVVDELEWAAQAHQWTVHGFADVDDRPGHPLSPLLNQIFSSENYAVNPYVAAEALYRKLSLDPGAGTDRSAPMADAFAVTTGGGGGGGGHPDTPPLHPNDNSCLPSALVLGLPSFSQQCEVRSNADRICRASHAAPVARAAAQFVASVVAATLQGRLEVTKTNPGLIEDILGELFEESMKSVPDSLEKAVLMKLWNDDLSLQEAGLPSSHVAYTLVYLKRGLVRYCHAVYGVDNSHLPDHSNNPPISDGVVIRTRPVITSTSSESAVADSVDQDNSRVVARMLSDSALISLPLDNSTRQPSDDADHQFARSQSFRSAPVQIKINNETLRAPAPSNNHTDSSSLPSRPESRSSDAPAVRSLAAPGAVFREVVAQVCMEGGWGACGHACVVGGVLGALGGYDALPVPWLKKLGTPNKRYINTKVNILLDMFGLP